MFLFGFAPRFWIVGIKPYLCSPIQIHVNNIILYAKTHPAVPHDGTTDGRFFWSESPNEH